MTCLRHGIGNYTPANQPTNSFVGGKWTLPEAWQVSPGSRLASRLAGADRIGKQTRGNQHHEPEIQCRGSRASGRPLMVGYPIRLRGPGFFPLVLFLFFAVTLPECRTSFTFLYVRGPTPSQSCILVLLGTSPHALPIRQGKRKFAFRWLVCLWHWPSSECRRIFWRWRLG